MIASLGHKLNFTICHRSITVSNLPVLFLLLSFLVSVLLSNAVIPLSSVCHRLFIWQQLLCFWLSSIFRLCVCEREREGERERARVVLLSLLFLH